MSVSNNYFKCQWTKYYDQKTQSRRLGNKTRTYNMLPTRDPLKGKRHTQIESEEIGGFPGGAVVGSLPANAGDMDSIPGLGGSHMPQSN